MWHFMSSFPFVQQLPACNAVGAADYWYTASYQALLTAFVKRDYGRVCFFVPVPEVMQKCGRFKELVIRT